MSKSRHQNTLVVRDPSLKEPRHYQTWDLPDMMKGYSRSDLLKNKQYITHIWQSGDRVDKLANKYLGDDQYGWIICLVNEIADPFSLTVGDVLRIPMNADVVLNQIGL